MEISSLGLVALTTIALGLNLRDGKLEPVEDDLDYSVYLDPLRAAELFRRLGAFDRGLKDVRKPRFFLEVEAPALDQTDADGLPSCLVSQILRLNGSLGLSSPRSMRAVASHVPQALLALLTGERGANLTPHLTEVANWSSPTLEPGWPRHDLLTQFAGAVGSSLTSNRRVAPRPRDAGSSLEGRF